MVFKMILWIDKKLLEKNYKILRKVVIDFDLLYYYKYIFLISTNSI
jgi:hypothetical protein